MKTVIQRVCEASVRVDGELVSAIGRGVLVLCGIERGDQERDAEACARKLASLRIFPGETPMDRTLLDVDGAALVVSQFTLAASLRKGRRPSFDEAEDPARANALYAHFCSVLREENIPTVTGRFGANMQVGLVNDGPVTFLLCSRDGALV